MVKLIRIVEDKGKGRAWARLREVVSTFKASHGCTLDITLGCFIATLPLPRSQPSCLFMDIVWASDSTCTRLAAAAMPPSSGRKGQNGMTCWQQRCRRPRDERGKWMTCSRKTSRRAALWGLFAPKIGTSCLTGQTCGSHRSDRCG
jgi:hypothetical protein